MNKRGADLSGADFNKIIARAHTETWCLTMVLGGVLESDNDIQAVQIRTGFRAFLSQIAEICATRGLGGSGRVLPHLLYQYTALALTKLRYTPHPSISHHKLHTQ